MKAILTTLLVMIVFNLFITPIIGQTDNDTLKPSKRSKGGELKGLYIAGGTSIVGGVTLGVLSNGFSEHPRSGLPVIAGSIGLAPGSLIGVGLGSLFSKNHSIFSSSFQVGLGMTYSSPIFSEFVSANSHKSGINIRVLSNELGPWRYSLSFSKFFAEEYEFENTAGYFGRTNLSWWELDLDLQYLIKINDSFKVYPFIGTQYNSVHSEGSKLKSEILANYGIGTNIIVSNSFNVLAEMKYTVDPDDNPGNMSFSIGLLYYL